MMLIGYKDKYSEQKISIATYNFYPEESRSHYEPIYQDIQTSDSSVPVAGDGMKSKEEILQKHYLTDSSKTIHCTQEAIEKAMEEYASQNQPNHSEVDWDEAFDLYVKESEQVSRVSLAVNLFHFLKSNFTLTKIK